MLIRNKESGVSKEDALMESLVNITANKCAQFDLNNGEIMSDFISPAVLAMNIIRYIGDRVSETGKSIPQLGGAAGIAGAPNNDG